MSKRHTGGQVDSIFNSTAPAGKRTGPERPKARKGKRMDKTSETSKTSERRETSGTSKTVNKGGRPRKDRPEVKKYTVVLTPEQWKFLNVYAAERETDRSGILRALVDQLQAGGTNV